MLYKVTPVLNAAEAKKPAVDPAQAKEAPAKEPRKKRKSAVFDADGHEVLITMMCLKCRQMKPLGMFGLRKMADGAIRNQPWCRTCRSGAGTRKKPEAAPTVETAAVAAGQEVPAEVVAAAALGTSPETAAPAPSAPEAPRSPIEEMLAGPLPS